MLLLGSCQYCRGTPSRSSFLLVFAAVGAPTANLLPVVKATPSPTLLGGAIAMHATLTEPGLDLLLHLLALV